jgi:hypothetical protein
MLLDCHMVRRLTSQKQRKQGVPVRTTQPARTLEQIESDLDEIFAEVHRSGEYTFEHGWREDGVTSVMLLAHTKRHGLKAFVHSAGGLTERYVPESADLPQLDDSRPPLLLFYGTVREPGGVAFGGARARRAPGRRL